MLIKKFPLGKISNNLKQVTFLSIGIILGYYKITERKKKKWEYRFNFSNAPELPFFSLIDFLIFYFSSAPWYEYDNERYTQFPQCHTHSTFFH